MTGDDRDDVVADALHDLAESAVGRARSRGQRGGRGTLVDEHDDDVSAGVLSRSAAAPASLSTMDEPLMSAMPPGETSDGRSSVTAPTKPTSTPSTSSSTCPRRRFRGRPRRRAARRCCRPSCGRWRRGTASSAPPSGLPVASKGAHHPVDEVTVAGVELVVAGCGHVEPGGVDRVDGRLVLLDERLERRGADQVATRREDGAAGPPRSCWIAPANWAAPASAHRWWCRALRTSRPWKSLVPRIWMSRERLAQESPRTLRRVGRQDRRWARWRQRICDLDVMLTRVAFRLGACKSGHPNPASDPSTVRKVARKWPTALVLLSRTGAVGWRRQVSA